MGRQRRFSEHLLIPFLVLLFAWPLSGGSKGDETYQTVVRASAPIWMSALPEPASRSSSMMMHPWRVLGRPWSQRAPRRSRDKSWRRKPNFARFYWPQISLVLDGIPLNLATFRTGPNQYARFVPTMALQALTITEGPASTLYGQGALGGALHFKTRALDSQTGYRSVFSAESADEGLGGALTLTSPLKKNTLQLMVGQGNGGIASQDGWELSGTW